MARGRGRGGPRGRGVTYTFDTRNLIGDSRSAPDEENQPLPPTLFPPLYRKLSVRSTPAAEEESRIKQNWDKKARSRFEIPSGNIKDCKIVVNEAMFSQKRAKRPKDSGKAKKIQKVPSNPDNEEESEKAKTNDPTNEKNSSDEDNVSENDEVEEDIEQVEDYISSYFDNGESYIDEDESKEDTMAW